MITPENTNISNELILGVAGMFCTLLGAFFGALFSYLSLNKQFSHSVKKIRIERTFDSYEQLLELIIVAQSTVMVVDKGIKHPVSSILYEAPMFRNWYPDILESFHQKKYLLDPRSLSSCNELSIFITKFLDKYPNFRANSSALVKSASFAELFKLQEELSQLLSNAYESLRNHLLHGIEKA